MKFMQINVQRFRLAENLFEYIRKEDPDIIAMHEIAEGLLCEHESIKTGHIDVLTQSLGYYSYFAKAFGVQGPSGDISDHGNMILSKFPIVDTRSHWTHWLGSYVVIDYNMLGLDVDTSIPGGGYKKYVLWQDLPVVIAEVVCKLSDELCVRILTTHMTASPGCTETLVMRHHSQTIGRILNDSKKLATIVSGDFNIRPQSWTVQHLTRNMHMVVDQHTNTLNKQIHPGFNNDIPDAGYQVDHVFSRGFKCIHWSVDSDSMISDHYPILVDMDLT